MITVDLQLYYTVVAAILAALAGAWGFRRVKSLFSSR
jgi:hypothetical protein